MYIRPTQTETLSSSNIKLEEKKNHDQYSNDKDRRRKRFKSPMRNIFKPKSDEKTESPYYRLEEKEQQYTDLQFSEPPAKIPIHAIILATSLFLIGSIMITLGSLMLTGHIQTQYSDRTWPLILVGSLVFLPGFYHLRIAYWAWKETSQNVYETECKECAKPTWKGCGKHIEQALKDVPEDERCKCPRESCQPTAAVVNRAEETKVETTTSDTVKSEETTVDDKAKTDETKVDDTMKSVETKVDDKAQTNETKADDTVKSEETKVDDHEVKSSETKADEKIEITKTKPDDKTEDKEAHVEPTTDKEIKVDETKPKED